MYSLEFIKSRHSVRRYLDKAIPKEFVDILQEEIRQCNLEGNINLQLVLNDDNAFSGMRANYGSIKGVKNYIVLVGKRCKNLDEKLGYYGERIVLKAHELGLNTCWIGLSMLYKKTKGAYEVNKGETKRLIIAIGYGENQGHPRSSKIFDDVTNIAVKEIPNWFKNGVEYTIRQTTEKNLKLTELNKEIGNIEKNLDDIDIKEKELKEKLEKEIYAKDKKEEELSTLNSDKNNTENEILRVGNRLDMLKDLENNF